MKPADLCQSRVIHVENIERARTNALEFTDIDRVTKIFKAMGDPTRLKILWALKLGEMCVCDIAAFLGISESAISHQLRTLRHLELVANRRQGTILYYRLNDEHVSRLIVLALEHVRE